MQLVDFYPHKSFFQPGETVGFFANITSNEETRGHLRVRFFHLQDEIDSLFFPIQIKEGFQRIFTEWRAVQNALIGFGVEVFLEDHEGDLRGIRSTAFDVLDSWLDYPRYGFVTDFQPGRKNIPETVDRLVRHHVNGLQFYDWGYRHDSLLPSTQTFVDPLGRELSLVTISNFITAARARGIAAMPYLTVYAASIEFWQKHKNWGLFDKENKPIMFEGFLAYMDPSPDSPWSDHLMGECDRLIRDLPFDGFHVDQYGEPKIAFNANGDLIDFPTAFQWIISNLKKQHNEKAVTFNAVSNWPIKELAVSDQDFNYIEVWQDSPLYLDLFHIVSEASVLSKGKPVVIALYQPVENIENILLANAIIFSSGGTRIQLGEDERWLADPYFPKHQPLSPELQSAIRRYNDFCVRYGEWLGPWTNKSRLESLDFPIGVWGIMGEIPGWLIINLINLSRDDGLRWDQAHQSPDQIDDVRISIPGYRKIQEVMIASPDLEDLKLRKIPWKIDNSKLNIELDYLKYWTLIAIKY